MISVCIATHNGERYIKEQLDSILCQLGPDDEVVISDDGSTDNTICILEGYNDSRIKIYNFIQPQKSTDSHTLVTRNFQNALLHASGDYIFLSDQDDMWYPQKVKIIVGYLNDYMVVYHNLRYGDENLIDLGENRYNSSNGYFRRRNYLNRKGVYYGCALAFRREVLDVALPFPQHLNMHDYWLGILAESIGPLYYIDDPLILYRLRGSSVSHKVDNNLIKKIGYRFYNLFFVICRIIKYKFVLRRKNEIRNHNAL